MPLQTPEALRAQLRTRWQRNRQAWLAGEGQWPLRLPLGVPTEAQAGANWAYFDVWLRAWRNLDGAGEIEWMARAWPRLGEQRLPSHWRLDSAQSVADAVGEGERWHRAQQRHAAWLVRFGRDDPGTMRRELARQFDLLADTDEPEYQRLLDVLAWLLQHPESGLYLRQLPIAGIDSKWMEPYRTVLAAWLARLRGIKGRPGFEVVAGLRIEPDKLRVRLLDAGLRARLSGVGDVTAPVADIANMALPARCAFIVENIATGLACTDVPGAVVFLGKGYAISSLGQVPWLHDVPVFYWGDIDTHGLAILHRLRTHLPHVRSLMMDETTLLAFEPLWVEEPKQAFATDLECLSDAERTLYSDLIAGRFGTRVRLEQERIDWGWAWARIEQATSELRG